MKILPVLIALVAWPVVAHACISHDPAGFDGCSGRVASIETWEDSENAGDTLVWLYLDNVACTDERGKAGYALFLLGTDKDKSLSTKVALAQGARAALPPGIFAQQFPAAQEFTVVFKTQPITSYPHVLRVNVPGLEVCPKDAESVAGRITDLGARSRSAPRRPERSAPPLHR